MDWNYVSSSEGKSQFVLNIKYNYKLSLSHHAPIIGSSINSKQFIHGQSRFINVTFDFYYLINDLSRKTQTKYSKILQI